MIRHHPYSQLLRQSCPRGVSLIEAVVVMSLMGTVLLLVVSTLKLALTMNNSVADEARFLSTASRLGRQFRSDVHQTTWSGLAVTPEQLTLGNIAYQVDGSLIVRTEDDSRNTFALRPETTATFQWDSQAGTVELIVASDGEQSAQVPIRALRFLANTNRFKHEVLTASENAEVSP